MKTNEISQLAKTINEHLNIRVHNGELSNIDKISIVENMGDFLNLETKSRYAKRNGISYNTVKKRLATQKIHSLKLFGVVYIIDND